jgi:hypothetical protein
LQWQCFQLEIELFGKCLFPHFNSLLWHLACYYLKENNIDAIERYGRVLLVALVDEKGQDIVTAKGYATTEAVRNALKSIIQANNTQLALNSDEEDSSSSLSRDDSDSSLVRYNIILKFLT